MADSENSRTLPKTTRRKRQHPIGDWPQLPSRIDRKNLLGAVAKILVTLISELEKAPDRKMPGPTSTARLWLNWYDVNQRLVRITKYQQKIESKVHAMAGAFPLVQIEISPNERPITVYTVAEINRLKSRVDPAQLASARSLLRKRRESWNEADRKLGYSPALAFEHDLAEQEAMLSRVLFLSKPKTIVETTAKLHCLMSTQDPGTKGQDAPWPELRKILLDLVEVELAGNGRNPFNQNS